MMRRATVLQVGHLNAEGVPIGWEFKADTCTPAQILHAHEATDLMEAVRWLGWSRNDILEFWLHLRRN